MKIDLTRLQPGMQTLEEDDQCAFADVDGTANRMLCRVKLEIRKVGETVYIHGSAGGSYQTPCHRCLEPADVSIESEFDVVVKRATERRGAAGAEDRDLVFVPADAGEIDLDAQIYDSLVADIPMRVVCREDCKGLCPGCGANLNTEKCRCGMSAGAQQNEAGASER